MIAKVIIQNEMSSVAQGQNRTIFESIKYKVTDCLPFCVNLHHYPDDS